MYDYFTLWFVFKFLKLFVSNFKRVLQKTVDVKELFYKYYKHLKHKNMHFTEKKLKSVLRNKYLTCFFYFWLKVLTKSHVSELLTFLLRYISVQIYVQNSLLFLHQH